MSWFTPLIAAVAIALPDLALAMPAPSPDLSPEAVVRLQVQALRDNDATDAGIAAVFAFASPTNQRQTGPLARFREMLRTPPYDALLNHRAAQFGLTALSPTRLQQVVTITTAAGDEQRFLWIVSRQSDGVCAGCWMTDAVITLKISEGSKPVWSTGPLT